MNQFIVVPPNPETPAYSIDATEDWDLLREKVGGFIEVVNLGSCVLIVDEEGLLKQGNEANAFASSLYSLRGAQTPIMGTVLIVDTKHSPEFSGVPEKWAENFVREYEINPLLTLVKLNNTLVGGESFNA